MAICANGIPQLSNALRRVPGRHGFSRAVRRQPVLELVWEILVVRLLTNPIMLRAVLMLVRAGGAFVFMIWMMRSLRRSITEESDLDSATSSTLETLPL